MTEPLFAAAPEVPQGVRNAIKALAPGWTYRLTPGRGVTTVRKKVADPRLNDGLKTALTDVPVESLGLRCVHTDGRRAWAVWVRREDTGKWEFSAPACAWRPGGRPWFVDMTSRNPEVVTWKGLVSKVIEPAKDEPAQDVAA